MAKRNNTLPTLKKLKTRNTGPISAISLTPRTPVQAPGPSMGSLASKERDEARMFERIRAMGGKPEEATDDRNWLEKKLNLRQDQGLFGDLFETLGRPMQAVQGALIDKDALGGAFKGLTGKEYYGGERLLHQFGITDENSPKWLQTIGGFAADLATDPLAWSNKPFQLAGKGIKALSSAGVKVGKTVLETTEVGTRIARTIERNIERLKVVSKNSFGLWRDEAYKGWKTKALNRTNSILSSNEHMGTVLRDAYKDVDEELKQVVNNRGVPKNSKFIKDLKLNPATATFEEVRDAAHEAIYAKLENNRKFTLSKQEIYKKLGEDWKNGHGRFFVVERGTEGKRQADKIMNEIRNDWEEQFGSVIHKDDLNYDGKFINVGPEITAFLNRTVRNVDNILTRKELFGNVNAIQGVFESLAQTGKVTLNLADPAELQIFNLVESRFKEGIKADIKVAGNNTASISLTNTEIKKLLQTDDMAALLKESQDIKNTRTAINEYNKQLNKAQLAHISTKVQGGMELSRLQKELEALETKKLKLIENMGPVEKTNKKLIARREARQTKLHQTRKDVRALERDIEKKTIEFENELRKVSMTESRYSEYVKEFDKKLNFKENTIKRIEKETGIRLAKDATIADANNAMLSPAFKNVEISATADATRKLSTEYNDLLKKYISMNDESFYRVKMKNPLTINANERINSIIESLEGMRERMYESLRGIYGENSEALKAINNLNTSGYMRHVVNEEVTIYNNIQKIEGNSLRASQKRNEVISRLGDNAKFFKQNWLGSAPGINRKLGIKLFNANPVESLAVSMKILPNQFEAINLLSTAKEEGLIRSLADEEAAKMSEIITNKLKEGMGMQEAKLFASKEVLSNEYKIIGTKEKDKLKQSMEFIIASGVKGEDATAIMNEIEKIDEASDMIMHKGVMNSITRFSKKIGDEDVDQIFRSLNKYFIQPFKSIATLSAGFHVRNNLTNITNAYLAGIKPTTFMKHFGMATRDITRVETKLMPKLSALMVKGGKEVKTIEGQMRILSKLPAEEQRLFNKMMEWQSKGVLGANRFSQDFNTILDKVDRGRIRAAGKKVIDTSMKVGKLSDDASKIAAYEFAKGTKEGKALLASHGMKNPEEFSRFVFFDYTDLSSFESKYMRALFPFYTWTRKNIEFQMKNMLKNPKRYVRLAKTLNHWQDHFTENRDDITGWDREQMLLPVWRDKHGKITMLKVSPAFLDLEDVYKSPLTRLSPLIKAPLEVMTGTNFFSGDAASDHVAMQIGGEIFGNPKEMWKSVMGEEYDKGKLGLIGSKVAGISGAVRGIATGTPSPEGLMPSIFREADTEKNQERAIDRRMFKAREYLDSIRGTGKASKYKRR